MVERCYGDLPAIECRPGQLSQVFLNLIVNAYQALSAEGGTLRVATEIAGTHVLVAVEDDGPGVQPEAVARLVGPFFPPKPAGAGTGRYGQGKRGVRY